MFNINGILVLCWFSRDLKNIQTYFCKGYSICFYAFLAQLHTIRKNALLYSSFRLYIVYELTVSCVWEILRKIFLEIFFFFNLFFWVNFFGKFFVMEIFFGTFFVEKFFFPKIFFGYFFFLGKTFSLEFAFFYEIMFS